MAVIAAIAKYADGVIIMDIKIANEKQDSISIKPLAKGGFTWEAKLYFDDSSEKNAEYIIARLDEIRNKLNRTFKGE